MSILSMLIFVTACLRRKGTHIRKATAELSLQASSGTKPNPLKISAIFALISETSQLSKEKWTQASTSLNQLKIECPLWIVGENKTLCFNAPDQVKKSRNIQGILCVILAPFSLQKHDSAAMALQARESPSRIFMPHLSVICSFSLLCTYIVAFLSSSKRNKLFYVLLGERARSLIASVLSVSLFAATDAGRNPEAHTFTK